MENVPFNDRGFLVGKFKDDYGREGSLQESSASAGNDGSYIWLGMDEPELFEDVRTGPGKPYKLPENVTSFSRLHLSQTQIKELLPHLQYFAETGSLPSAEQLTHFTNHLEMNGYPTIIIDYFNEVSS